MVKTMPSRNAATAQQPALRNGPVGELHQVVATGQSMLTTNHGMPISDDHSSLHAGPRGAHLLEDMVLRETIFQFDHKRIPERVIPARGLAAHGTFEPTDSLSDPTTAIVLGKVGTVAWVHDAFAHLMIIRHDSMASLPLDAAGTSADAFIDAAAMAPRTDGPPGILRSVRPRSWRYPRKGRGDDPI